MSNAWDDLDAEGRAVAHAVFAALDGADRLTDGETVPAGASASAVWSALVNGRPLPAGTPAGPDLEAMLDRAAVAAMSRRAAAATPGEGVDRRAAGARVRVVPSRADTRQSYLTVSLDDPAASAVRLLVLVDRGPAVEVALPAMVDGTVQILLDDDAPVLAALTDPDARLYLV